MEYAKARARSSVAKTSLADDAPHSRVRILDLDWLSPDRWTAQQYSEFARELKASTDPLGFRGVILTGEALFRSTDYGPATPDADWPDTERLDEILQQVRESPIPIIAAIPGDASGPGFELAMACAGRVARSMTVLSLPGIDAARLPRFETLMRLPMLAGGEAAAEMIALARPMGATEALSRGLLDALPDEDLIGAAHSSICALGTVGDTRSPATDPFDLQAQFFLVRRTLRDAAPGQLAPLSAVRALEAVARMRPRAAKLEIGRIASELTQSQQGAALRHAAWAVSSFKPKAAGLDFADPGLEQRLWWPMAREAIHLLDEGASPAQVDKSFTDYGFGMGPFAKSDVHGFEQVFSSRDGALAGDHDWRVYSPTLDLMADSGRLGGRRPGWYQPMTASHRFGFEPAVDLLIQSSAISQRIRRKPIGDLEIMQRCLNAATNASFAVLGADQDMTSYDIDALWLSRLDFPRCKGGPIYQAGLGGLRAMISQLAARAAGRNTAGAPCDQMLAFARQMEPPLSLAAGE